MTNWICEACESLLPGEFKSCPKCNESYALVALKSDNTEPDTIDSVLSKIPTITMELPEWFRKHHSCRFKVDIVEDHSVLIRCILCEEFYLL